jgi:hypothetical protein
LGWIAQRSTLPENGGESRSGFIPENNFRKIQKKGLTFFVEEALLSAGQLHEKVTSF